MRAPSPTLGVGCGLDLYIDPHKDPGKLPADPSCQVASQDILGVRDAKHEVGSSPLDKSLFWVLRDRTRTTLAPQRDGRRPACPRVALGGPIRSHYRFPESGAYHILVLSQTEEVWGRNLAGLECKGWHSDAPRRNPRATGKGDRTNYEGVMARPVRSWRRGEPTAHDG